MTLCPWLCFCRMGRHIWPRACSGSRTLLGPCPCFLLVPVRVLVLGGPLPSCSPTASLLHPSPRPSLSLPVSSIPRVLGSLQSRGTHGPTSGPFSVPGTDSFSNCTRPSDPWDPGLTAQDLLFRGGPKFRRQPKAVLDVTEQVSGPTGDSAVWLGLCLVTWCPLLPQFSRFLWDHGDIAFAPLGKLMLENFKLEGARVSDPGQPGEGLPVHIRVSLRVCVLNKAFPRRATLRRRQWSVCRGYSRTSVDTSPGGKWLMRKDGVVALAGSGDVEGTGHGWVQVSITVAPHSMWS